MSPEPTRLGRYELRRQVGRGGMGEVYAALDTELGRSVAIKRLFGQADPELLARFQREADLMSRIDHPGVARILDVVFRGPGAPFLVLELIEGQDLRALVRERALDHGEIVAVMADLCDAVAAAHAQGVLHRDLKPENVMYRVDGRVAVLDFGVARSLLDERRSLTQTGELLGTAAYMAPEQAHGEAGPASDQYSLGGILYFCLTGRPPFEGPNAIAILASAAQDPPLPPRELVPDVDPGLEAIALRCLAKAPQSRFPDVAAVAEALRALDDPALEPARPRRSVWVAGATVALLVVVGALLAGSWRPTEVARPAPPSPLVSSPTEGQAESIRQGLIRLLAERREPLGEEAAEGRSRIELGERIKALQRDLTVLCSRSSAPASAHLLRAEVALCTRQVDLAVEAAERARKLGGGPAALRVLALACVEYAVEKYLRVIEFAPAEVQRLLDQARNAVDALANAGALTPQDRVVRHIAERRHAAALTLLERSPGAIESEWLKCLALILQRKDGEQLRRTLSASVAEQPRDPRARSMGVALFFDQADADIDGHLAHLVPYGSACAWLFVMHAERYLEEGDTNLVEQALTRLGDLAPEDPRIQLVKARLRVLDGDLEEAVTIVKAVLGKKPRHHEALGLLGKISRANGDERGAVTHFRAAIEERSDWVDHWQSLASALRQLGRIQPAVAACLQALKLDPRLPDELTLLAELYRKLGLDRKGEEALTRAIDLCRDGVRFRRTKRGELSGLDVAYYNRARLRIDRAMRLESAGRPARQAFRLALADYDLVIAGNPNVGPPHEGRAYALERLGRRAAAAVALEQCVRLGAPNAEILQAKILELRRPSKD